MVRHDRRSLTRSFNFGTPINIAEDVQDFGLSCVLESRDEQFTGLTDSGDHSGGNRIPLRLSLALQSGSTQTLTAEKKIDDATWVTLDQVTGLSTDFIDIRLLIDPASDTVVVSYDGVELGAYDYLSFSQGTADKFASIYEDTSHAEFDFVSIRVSEP